MKKKIEPKAIVLRTAGTNCDIETMNALKFVGFAVERVHVNELIRKERSIFNSQLLVIPGGFSQGDYLGSGKILANKLLYKLNGLVQGFIEKGNLVLGICNGFQVLVKAGFLPGFSEEEKKQDLTLTFNSSSVFQCEWVKLLNENKGKCIWSKGINSLYIPIAHAEGRLDAEKEILKKLYEKDLIVFKYEKNPNGSIDSIAGICDETGRVLGLMPHPERNYYSLQDPRSLIMDLPEEGEGIQIFRNGYNYIKENILK